MDDVYTGVIPKELHDMDSVLDLRSSELSKIFSPHFSSFDNYRKVLISLSVVLGEHAPKDNRDRTIRNFMADTYDFLEELSVVVRKGRHNVAFVMVRRMYENVSLVNAFVLNNALHDKWFVGSEIGNKEVRVELDKSIFGAEVEATKRLYFSLSDRAHPSRIAISNRFLGEGNDFSLGGYITPSLALTAQVLTEALSLIFWFCAVLGYFYKQEWSSTHPSFRALYEKASAHAQHVNKQLISDLDRLYEDESFEVLGKS